MAKVAVESGEFLVVGVGASAGGLEALKRLLAELPSEPGLSLVVIQHLDPHQKSHLPELLASVCRLPVREARDGERVRANHVYVIPADRDLTLRGGELQVTPRNEERRLFQPVDCFFVTLAHDVGERAAGVVLSGSGTDGAHGISEIKAAGGAAFAQDPQSAEQPAMPQAAVATGLVDFVLTPEEIARELVILARARAASVSEDILPPEESEARMALLRLVHSQCGADFSQYKQSTVWRRIRRRMNLRRISSLGEYSTYLKNTPSEANALYSDILINVTSFFRDAEVFDVLKRQVFAVLTRRRTAEEVIRVWVPGCSTGEEVYTIAMCLVEHLGENAAGTLIQVFGTDINESVVEKARLGIYSERILDTVSPERLQRFFVKVGQGYQVSKALRDMCVFARQNVVADPPLSRMDLISCRNLLIYLSPPLQKRVIPRLHYALRSGGHLLLGKSEVIDLFSDLFQIVDKRAKLYVKKPTGNRALLELSATRPTSRSEIPRKQHLPDGILSEVDLTGEVDRMILQRFTPPGVVIDKNLDILQFRGDINPYLDLNSRRAALNLAKVVPHGFVKQVQSLIEKAAGRRTASLFLEGVRVRYNRDFKRVDVHLVPLRRTEAGESFLLWFEDAKPVREKTRLPEKIAHEPSTDYREELRRLEEELTATREYLQSTLDERDQRNEELQAANEEVLSSNEELQTMNQELETSKEELESANEELATLNEELQHRLEQLRETEERFRILVSQVKEYAIFLVDVKGTILSWNEGAERIKGYRADEVIGKNFAMFYPSGDTRKAAEELAIAAKNGVFEDEALRLRRDGTQFWANVVISPLHDENDRLYGFAKVTRDVTERKRTQEELKRANEGLEVKVAERTRELEASNSSLRAEMQQRLEAEERIKQREAQLRLITNALPVLVAYIDPQERYLFANKAYGEWFGPAADGIVGSLVRDIVGAKNFGQMRPYLRKALNGESLSFEALIHYPQIGSRFVLATYIPDINDAGQVRGVVTLVEDITGRRHYEEELRRQAVDLVRINRELTASNDELSQFAHVASHDLKEPLRMVKTFTQLLQRQHRDRFGEDEIQYMNYVIEGANRMQTLIDDLLAYSAVGRTQLPMKDIDLNKVAQAAMFPLQKVIEDTGAKVTIDSLPTVHGNQTLLTQLLQNLLGNALKFRTEARPQVRISAELHEKSWRISVQDNGIGIDPDFHERIFIIFQRLHSRQDYPGTGIGLAICRKIVERHGGKIWLESEVGKGATFFFTLPVKE